MRDLPIRETFPQADSISSDLRNSVEPDRTGLGAGSNILSVEKAPGVKAWKALGQLLPERLLYILPQRPPEPASIPVSSVT
jgi:hypothetical protein